MGMLSSVPKAEWQQGHARLALATPASCKAARHQCYEVCRHGMLRSCLCSRSMGPHPRRCRVTLEVLSSLFPAQVPSWQTPSTMVGLAGSGAHQSFCTFGNEACTLLPSSLTEQKLTLSFSCPLRAVQVSQEHKEGLTKPQLQDGGTYCANWGILFDFSIPHMSVLMPSNMRPEVSCVAHLPFLPLHVVLSSSSVFLAQDTCTSPPCQREHNP